MLRTSYREREVEIKFGHMQLSCRELSSFGINISVGDDEPRKCSVCYIFVHDFGFSFSGISVCDLNDNFCKNTGRKRALANALGNMSTRLSLSKEDRQKIWDDYRSSAMGRTRQEKRDEKLIAQAIQDYANGEIVSEV